jgi:hypothetical protein
MAVNFAKPPGLLRRKDKRYDRAEPYRLLSPAGQSEQEPRDPTGPGPWRATVGSLAALGLPLQVGSKDSLMRLILALLAASVKNEFRGTTESWRGILAPLLTPETRCVR